MLDELQINPADRLAQEIVKEFALQSKRYGFAKDNPAGLLHFCECVDTRSGDIFEFQLLDREESELLGVPYRGDTWRTLDDFERSEPGEIPIGDKDWSWQRDYLDWVVGNDQTVALKGRQLGVTWIVCGLALHYLLFRPGSDVLIYSQGEDEAIQALQRVWGMLISLPSYLRGHVTPVKPAKWDGNPPSQAIEVRHPDGRISSITAMPSTKKAGHSRAAAFVIFDECARHDYAREAWKAVVPATGDSGGKIAVISTANGMSDEKAGTGNFFHHLCVKAGTSQYPRLEFKFLRWDLHPTRDKAWRDSLPMDEDAKDEQYPNTPEDAFLLSGQPYFPVSQLKHYSSRVAEPIYRFRWEVDPRSRGKRGFQVRDKAGAICVYREPEEGHKYAVIADCATGAGTDYTYVLVLDLSDYAPVCDYHTHEDQDVASEQVHFLGRWYNTARIVVENQGGYGATMLTHLRHQRDGRPAYPLIYKHRKYDKPERPVAMRFGFPMDPATRPLALQELRAALRTESFPWVTRAFMNEARTFVYAETKPSPRAAEGTNDDAVLCFAMACEVYREFGEHADDRRKQKHVKRPEPPPLYPWS